MPRRTYITKEEKSVPGHKSMKDRLTLLCGNASGDCKIKPLLVYHSENPRVFKTNNVIKSKLNVMWRANMNSSLNGFSKSLPLLWRLILRGTIYPWKLSLWWTMLLLILQAWKKIWKNTGSSRWIVCPRIPLLSSSPWTSKSSPTSRSYTPRSCSRDELRWQTRFNWLSETFGRSIVLFFIA